MLMSTEPHITVSHTTFIHYCAFRSHHHKLFDPTPSKSNPAGTGDRVIVLGEDVLAIPISRNFIKDFLKIIMEKLSKENEAEINN